MPKAKAKVTNDVDAKSDGLFVTKSRTKRSRLSRLEEYDEDAGRAGSQKYQRLANMLETCTTKEADKSKTFLRDFQKEVKGKGMELKNFRQKKEQEFIEDQEKFIAAFKQLSQGLFDRKNGPSSVHRREDHPLFKQAQVWMNDHQAVITQIHLVEEQLRENKLELPAAEWKQDHRELRDVLDCSSRYGQVLVGSALAPEPASSAAMNPPNASEKDIFVRELFKESQDMLKSENWGHVAKKQLNQFSAIAHTVQQED